VSARGGGPWAGGIRVTVRSFVVVGSRARTARDFPLDDLCGSAGRWDLLARCVQAALFIAHDLRRDSELTLVLEGPPDPPKALRVEGATARGLNPDERSTVALLSRALELPLPPSGGEVTAHPGIHVSRRGLDDVLGAEASAGRGLVLLDEHGRDGWSGRVAGAVAPGGATFVLGDDTGLSEAHLAEVRVRDALELGLGPRPLHTDHCIVLVHNLLDRAGASG
jgi:tRNA (pseudouridine54-N1)-methyltransferase